MMTSSEIELVYVIKRFVINIDFNLSDYENTMQTLRKVEKLTGNIVAMYHNIQKLHFHSTSDTYVTCLVKNGITKIM